MNRENIKDVTTDITDIQEGNRIQGRAYDLDNHYNAGHESFGLINLDGMFGDLMKGIGSAAKVADDVWKAADPKSHEEMGGQIMGGISAGAEGLGGMNDEFGFDSMMGTEYAAADDWGYGDEDYGYGDEDYGYGDYGDYGDYGYEDDFGDFDFINLNSKPTRAIVATPAQALKLINLNSQLEHPYQIKGVKLI